ncbi:MAG: rod shape-determining protein MreD [Acidimicrobiales bacterium]
MTLRMWARLGLVTLVAVLVQVGVLNQIVLGGAHLDVMLLLAISAGVVAGPQNGAVMAFAVGLVADIFVQTPYGLSSFCYVLVAYAIGLAAQALPGRPTFGFQFVAALLGGVGGTLLFAGLDSLIGQPSVPWHHLLAVSLIVAAGCVLFANPVFRLFEWTVSDAPGARRHAGAFASGSAR